MHLTCYFFTLSFHIKIEYHQTVAGGFNVRNTNSVTLRALCENIVTLNVHFDITQFATFRVSLMNS